MIDFVPAQRGHFRLESGMHTDLWLDLDGLFADPKRIAPMVDALAAKLLAYDFDAICGAMLGGAFLAQLLAHSLGAEFWFTERKEIYVLPKAFDANGRRVIIVDDIMSAGAAMIGTYEAVEKAGARVVACAAFQILGDIGAQFFEKRGIPVESLARDAFNLWQPSACGLCASGVPIESKG